MRFHIISHNGLPLKEVAVPIAIGIGALRCQVTSAFDTSRNAL